MGRNLTVGRHAVVDEAGKTVPFHLVSSERISLHAVISIAYDDVRHTFSVSISQGTYDIEVLLDDRFYLLDGIFCHGFLLVGIWCLDSGRLRLLLIAQMKSDPDRYCILLLLGPLLPILFCFMLPISIFLFIFASI